MPLFRINSEPVLFDLINLDEAEYATFTDMIASEGGMVINDERLIVKFTSREAYDKNEPPVRTKIYDVRFIEECIRQRKIMRPEHYRLDERFGEDDYHVYHLLYGKCADSRQDSEVQLVTNPVLQRRNEVWEQENGGLRMVYSAKRPTGDSDTSGDQTVSIEHESIDESQPVLSAFLELEMSASSSAENDVDPVENHDVTNGEERTALKKKPKAKKARRKLPKFRVATQADAGDSSDSAAETTITSIVNTSANVTTTLSEPEIISDGTADGLSPRPRANAKRAGPSGVRKARKRQVPNNGEAIEGECLVRNIAHHSFLTHSINGEDEESKAEGNVVKKTSRGQEWRAKLKSQTDAQYTGVKARIPFTPSERKTMLLYLAKNHCISRAKGLVVWTQMITDGYLTERTPQSLQNQFRKYVLPNIEHVDYLQASDIQKFLALRSDRR